MSVPGARAIWIKICATTNIEDAVLAWEAGADAIGFVFDQRSARCVTPEQAAEIVDELARPIERIGVVMNLALSQMIDLLERGGLTGLQLHGDEAPEVIGELRALFPKARLIKSLRGGASADELIKAVRRYEESGADALLLDSHAAGAGGGTGKRFDWNEAAAALRAAHSKLPVIIAGGLAPENVGEAIETFRPFGVDVVSGVEHEKRKKDAQRVREFIRNARAAAERVAQMNAASFAATPVRSMKQ